MILGFKQIAVLKRDFMSTEKFNVLVFECCCRRVRGLGF